MDLVDRYLANNKQVVPIEASCFLNDIQCPTRMMGTTQFNNFIIVKSVYLRELFSMFERSTMQTLFDMMLKYCRARIELIIV
jgi:hypothetical protein